MPKALSFDLRTRVLAAIDAGLSCRQAAARFGVSASSAIRWQGMRRAGGDARPKPQGGDRLSRRTEAHADLIHAALAEAPDITLPELKARLAGPGAQVSVSALWRFCRRHTITRENSTSMAGLPSSVARVSHSRKSQIVRASGTRSPSDSPRKRMNESRSLIRYSARSSDRLFAAWMTRILNIITGSSGGR